MDHPAERHTLRGPIDRAALCRIRDVVETQEPLATPELDDYLDPIVLEVPFADGLCGAESARIDIQWTTRDDYKFHYSDSDGVNLRWGRHPHGDEYTDCAGIDHFHPPPAATSDPDQVEASCIEETTEVLVARGVLKCWRLAYERDSYEPLNTLENPP